MSQSLFCQNDKGTTLQLVYLEVSVLRSPYKHMALGGEQVDVKCFKVVQFKCDNILLCLLLFVSIMKEY